MMRTLAVSLALVLCFSTAGMAQLNSTQTLSELVGDSNMPKISVDGSNVYALWKGDNFINGVAQTEIIFRRSVDGGASWRKARNLSEERQDVRRTPATYQFRSPEGIDLASYGGNVYVVWSEENELPARTNYEIFGMRSIDGGKDFLPMPQLPVPPPPAPTQSQARKISRTFDGNSLCPAVAAQGDFVYVAWLDNQAVNNAGTPINGTSAYKVWYARSTDRGETFSAGIPIETLLNPPAGFSTEMECPQIAVSGSTVIVAWINSDGNGKSKVVYMRSTDSGGPNSFTGPFDIETTATAARREGLSLAASGNLFVAAWATAEDKASFEVFVARSLNRAKDFPSIEKPIDIVKDKKITKFPDLAIWNGSVWLTLTAEAAHLFDVLLLRSDKSGHQFDVIENLSNNRSTSIHSSVAAFNGLIHTVWMDNASISSTSNLRFRVKYRNNRPSTTFDPRVLSQDYGISDTPKVAISGSNVYSVWRSDDKGSGVFGEQILFRRSTNFGITFDRPIPLSNGGTVTPIHQSVADPAITAHDNFVVISWAQRDCKGGTSSNCPYDLYIVLSEDGGKTFHAPLPGGANLSALLQYGTTPTGCNFNTSSTMAAPYDPTGNDRSPALAMNDKYLYLLWSYDGEGSFDILYIRWRLSDIFKGGVAAPAIPSGATAAHCPASKIGTVTTGLTDSQFIALTTTPTTVRTREDDLQPHISVNGPALAIAWLTTGLGRRNGDSVFTLTSTNEGNEFSSRFSPSEITRRTSTRGSVFGEIACPVITIFQGNLFVAWSQFINSASQIFMIESPIGTTTARLSAPTQVTSSGEHFCPALERGVNNQYLAWHGRDSSAQEFEIKQIKNPRVSTGGATPSFTIENISNTSGDSEFVDLSLDSNDRIFAVWMDKSTGKPEIYFQSPGVVNTKSVVYGPSRPLQLRLQTLFKARFLVEASGAVASIQIQVYDLQGRLIAEQQAKGNRLFFNLSDSRGQPVANGVYLYRVTALGPNGGQSHSEVRKLLVLR